MSIANLRPLYTSVYIGQICIRRFHHRMFRDGMNSKLIVVAETKSILFVCRTPRSSLQHRKHYIITRRVVMHILWNNTRLPNNISYTVVYCTYLCTAAGIIKSLEPSSSNYFQLFYYNMYYTMYAVFVRPSCAEQESWSHVSSTLHVYTGCCRTI